MACKMIRALQGTIPWTFRPTRHCIPLSGCYIFHSSSWKLLSYPLKVPSFSSPNQASLNRFDSSALQSSWSSPHAVSAVLAARKRFCMNFLKDYSNVTRYYKHQLPESFVDLHIFFLLNVKKDNIKGHLGRNCSRCHCCCPCSISKLIPGGTNWKKLTAN